MRRGMHGSKWCIVWSGIQDRFGAGFGRCGGEGDARGYSPSVYQLSATAKPPVQQCGRCAEIYGGRANQGLWRIGWTEDRERAVARISACGRLSGWCAHHQCPERYGGFGKVFALYPGIGFALQCQQDGDADDGFGICFRLHGLSQDPSPRQYSVQGVLPVGLVWNPQVGCHLQLPELGLC